MNIYNKCVLKTYREKVNEIHHLSYVCNIDMYIAQKV